MFLGCSSVTTVSIVLLVCKYKHEGKENVVRETWNQIDAGFDTGIQDCNKQALSAFGGLVYSSVDRR